MKNIFSKIAGVLCIFLILSIIGMGLVQLFPQKQDDRLSSDVKIINMKNKFNLPSTVRYFSKMPGKYDEISINIELKSKEDLIVTGKDIKGSGIEFKASDDKLVLTDVKILETNSKIYIPAGTVISKSGYSLKNDFILMDLQIISSSSEYFGEFFKKFYYIFIIAFVLALISFIPRRQKSWHRLEDLDFNKGVVHMAILIPCLIFGGGVFAMLSNNIGRGTYDNDRTILIGISAFVIPLGIIAVYAVLTTLVYNIRSCGIFLGSAISIAQLILVMTVIYAAGAVLFTMFAGTKEIMDDRKKYYHR